MRTRFSPRLPFNTKKCQCGALAIGCAIALALLACTTPGEPAEQAKPKFSTQLLGQSDYPRPGQMTYRPPRILLEAEGVRVVFDLVNGKPYAQPVVILKITLLGPAGERRNQEIYVGPMLARETKRVSALVENIDFTPDDLTVELLTKH